MARFKHETTNRKIATSRALKEKVQTDWKPLVSVYPSKCAICNTWINKGSEILWHVHTKQVVHSNCPALEK